jgi:lupus La protein
MADTENAVAAATKPAEVTKTESSVEVKSDSKPEDKTTKSDDGEEKWELNGKSEEKNGRRNDREERSGRFGRDNNRRDGGRGRGQGRGNFRDNRNKRCAQ